jgi:hypothetical protein
MADVALVHAAAAITDVAIVDIAIGAGIRGCVVGWFASARDVAGGWQARPYVTRR